MPRVYTGGSFDLPHHGHYRLLERASHFGSVTVALNLNEFSKQYKGKTLIMSYEERREVLLNCKWVDEVIPNFGGADSKPAIELVKPDFIVIGSDWATKDYHAQMGFTQEWLDERGIILAYIPYTNGVSSTELRKRILESNQK
jgi:cytidyltransferase-like protein